ncbi:hypothetical protein [Acidicapsa ligni]|uniref:hypothetical protein n=1 Tax=Acidicapsa ligni TaxID=542300 RepID=UPI0021E0CAAE|nr:hypothetical protein [Acidicapsa ligni]
MLPKLFLKLLPVFLAACLFLSSDMDAAAPPKKPHTVVLSSVKQVPYSKTGDPAGAGPDESSLRTRALLIDGRISEWTTGDAHDVTDRSFVVRRALRINDNLPGDAKPAATSASASATGDKPAGAHWVWQRGPWLLVDRVTGHVTALKLPDYDPGASQMAWFRDYAAYCGITATGKSLYAIVAQVSIRKPVLAKKLSEYDAANHPWPVCGLPEWQRDPLKVTFHPAGRDAVSFDVVGGSAVLVEDGDETPETPSKP